MRRQEESGELRWDEMREERREERRKDCRYRIYVNLSPTFILFIFDLEVTIHWITHRYDGVLFFRLWCKRRESKIIACPADAVSNCEFIFVIALCGFFWSCGWWDVSLHSSTQPFASVTSVTQKRIVKTVFTLERGGLVWFHHKSRCKIPVDVVIGGAQTITGGIFLSKKH
jgi:hypothetical protein